jgi:HEAT repeat protein
LVFFSVVFMLPVAEQGSPLLAQIPGPELFAKEPQTPLELWDAIDYLVRTDQAKKAIPYLDKFMKSRPDDVTLITIRNRYGPGSILRLSDDELTRPFAKPLVEVMVSAAKKYAAHPERIRRFITDLTGTLEEQEYAVRHLREAGPDAVPFLVDAISRTDLSATDRQLIVHHTGRLDRSAVPPLLAVLDSPSPALVADTASALEMIGNKLAIPQLTFLAASANTPTAVRTTAQAAIASLTGRPFSAQPRTPVQVLTAAAWSYHRHQVELPSDPVPVWEWDKERKAPSMKEVPRTQAEAAFGLRLANEALQLDPQDREARVVQLSLMLEKAVERVGFTSFPAQDQATFAAATMSGPLILKEVIKTAVADGRTDLAAATVMALAQITNRTSLLSTAQPHPLVSALSTPGSRIQFAAAKALVNIAPVQPFPGSSRVVPTLARFLRYQAQARAVVIDSNPNRGTYLAGFLTKLGYDSEVELTGNQGFLAVAESTDVALVLISFDLFGEGWGLDDTLANFQADARTAAIPLLIFGPRNVRFKHPNLEQDYPRIKFLVQPADVLTLEQQLKTLPMKLPEAERAGYAREAAALLAQISSDHKSPLVPDLTAAVPSLAAAMNWADTAPNAALALGNIPDASAQRTLASVVLDPSRDALIRRQSTVQLVQSIQRFGRLITAAQEAHLATALREETDQNARAELMTVVRALRPIQLGGLTPPLILPVPAPPHTSSATPAAPLEQGPN